MVLEGETFTSSLQLRFLQVFLLGLPFLLDFAVDELLGQIHCVLELYFSFDFGFLLVQGFDDCLHVGFDCVEADLEEGLFEGFAVDAGVWALLEDVGVLPGFSAEALYEGGQFEYRVVSELFVGFLLPIVGIDDSALD